MDLERVLVSKILFTGQIEAALSREITVDHFYDDECRKMYQYILGHTRLYKSCPSLDAVKHDHPDFEFIQTQETIEWVIDRFAIQVKRKVANDMLEELAVAADDRERAENIDLEFLNTAERLIMALPTTKVSRFSEMDKRIAEFEKLKRQGKRLGIPYGIPTLDYKLGGIFPHELVAVFGWTNKGKSTLLRTIAFNMWVQGYTALYFSFEMGADEIFREFDALAAKLNRQKLKQLDLPDEQMSNWKKFASTVAQKKCDIPVVDPWHKVNPDYIYAEMLRHRPNVAIIDYVGMMRSSGSAQGVKRYAQLVEITQDLKWTARRLRIPIIMAAQTNRGAAKEGAELEYVADSISIAQDSDTVIGLHQDENMERNKEMEIRVNKSRSGPRPRFKMIWDQDIPEFREKTMKDLFGGGHGNEQEQS